MAYDNSTSTPPGHVITGCPEVWSNLIDGNTSETSVVSSRGHREAEVHSGVSVSSLMDATNRRAPSPPTAI